MGNPGRVRDEEGRHRDRGIVVRGPMKDGCDEYPGIISGGTEPPKRYVCKMRILTRHSWSPSRVCVVEGEST